MDSYLIALLPPTNITAGLAALQDVLFSQWGFESVRALPPIIPAGFIPGPLSQQKFETITSPLLKAPSLTTASLSRAGESLYIDLEPNDLPDKFMSVRGLIEQLYPGQDQKAGLFSLFPGIYLGLNQTGLPLAQFKSLSLEPLTFRTYSLCYFIITSYSPPDTWWYNMDYEVRYLIRGRKT